MTRSCCARCNLGRSSVGQHQLRSRQAGQVAQQRRAGKAYSPVIKAEAQDVRSAGSWRSAAASSLLQILAAATILAQPSPAWAGEVIQGTPRVADGDTLQASCDAMLTALSLACLT